MSMQSMDAMQLPIKIPVMYFTELEQISKIYMEAQMAQHNNSDPEKENKVEGITLPNIKLYLRP